MKIGILYKKTERAKAAAARAKEVLFSLGAEAFFLGESGDKPDRVLVIGGDGTVLKAVRAFSVPVVGVNFGTLGFLCEFRAEELDRACRLAVNESAALIKRNMLEAQWNGVSHSCLNEISFLRRLDEHSSNGTVTLETEIDGVSLGKTVSDGVILSTPTGSTAYSRSAGGPLLTPDCANFILTPVCPFRTAGTSFVYPDDHTVNVRVVEGGELLLYCDGLFVGTATEITVKKSEKIATFLTGDAAGFLRRFIQKIN